MSEFSNDDKRSEPRENSRKTSGRRKMIILAIFLASSSYGKYVKKSLEDVKKKTR